MREHAQSVDADDGVIAGHDHPTEKPMEVMRRPILNHTLPGVAVNDCFLGLGDDPHGGRTKRRSAAVRNSIRSTWTSPFAHAREYTGKQAVLDGGWRVFDEIAEKRGTVAA